MVFRGPKWPLGHLKWLLRHPQWLLGHPKWHLGHWSSIWGSPEAIWGAPSVILGPIWQLQCISRAKKCQFLQFHGGFWPSEGWNCLSKFPCSFSGDRRGIFRSPGVYNLAQNCHYRALFMPFDKLDAILGSYVSSCGVLGLTRDPKWDPRGSEKLFRDYRMKQSRSNEHSGGKNPKKGKSQFFTFFGSPNLWPSWRFMKLARNLPLRV